MAYVHVYTGNGKGKTTAAFGLAVRAACAGLKVYIGQFIKGMKYSELDIVKYFPNIELEQFGRGCFIKGKPDELDVKLAREGLKKVEEKLTSGKYDLVILDEANIAIYFNLFTVQELIGVLNKRSERTEVVVTGRYAPKELIDYADLVTEMVEVKHYYTKGVMARKGIEF
ncbi:cob(I)yrinic acid a,c-diamide adenosyltransferase [Pseudothermotoga thermarum]|uniref:Cob(I)yrinic acid a,c-diamide adenosyltransferase n=1 Tax=Pseudothermotoga thermarum DSM 5069 TaxID=688269 RepID=F7YVV4_9THEM|nr:cob(I)yrinic acid a,c-diamide adenosyltransferase [Pseudothermotoga thermarum]AEH51776.1 cob(I)yrinic acid a,c-diamide adenosyltransferase [Pseudothermotoga thermarum DSM 5069]